MPSALIIQQDCSNAAVDDTIGGASVWWCFAINITVSTLN